MHMHSIQICVCVCVGGVEEPEGLVAGDRAGNQWLQYQHKRLPRCEEEWNRTTFVEKTHWGYYTWPR